MATAQRIASLLSSSTEILFALGLGERVVAISHECDYPPEATNKPRVTSTRVAVNASSGDIDRQVQEMSAGGMPLYDLDVEALERLRPDLIVTQAQCDVCAVRYEDVVSAVSQGPLCGTPVVALNPSSLAEFYEDIRRVAVTAGCEVRGDALIAELRQRVQAVRKAIARRAEKHQPRIACIEWLDPIMIAGNWMPELIELAGGQQPLQSPASSLRPPPQHSPYVAWEVIREYDPEVIVLMPCGFDLSRTVREAPALFSLPGWSETTAARTERVFAVDGNAYFNRSGPRLIDSLEILAHLVHPECVKMPAPCRGAWKEIGGVS